ncbi:MAG: LacI family DNA-binding transcriptional regulator [Cyclobacteriaceae bacterium]
MNKKATIHDIAKKLNTTAATVSRALNDNPRISEKMKKRVLHAAKQIGYEPNQLASALRKGRTNVVGVIVPYIDRSFFSSAIRGIEEEVKKHGYNVMICQSSERVADEELNVETLMQAQVSGVILSLAGTAEGHLQRVLDQGIPLVTFDRVADQIQAHGVGVDDFQGTYLVTKHLLEQGYTRIAHFQGNQQVNIYRERYRGYRTALEEAGQVINEAWVLPADSKIEEGRQAAERLMAMDMKVDAISSSSDFSALGAMQYCKSVGMRIPEEIGIAGFSNEPFTELLDPPMTTVSQNSQDMGALAARVFLDELDEDGVKTPKRVLLKPDLLIRASTNRKN